MAKVQDIIYAGFRVPDLDKMESFLTDFGMVRAHRTADRLYMRGAGAWPYINVIEKGDPGFVACGMAASSMADLEKLAGIEGASKIETIEAPGGGKRVRLASPDGFRIDACFGIERASEIAIREPLILNYARDKNRYGSLQRPEREPAKVFRLGHCVWKVADVDKTAAWFQKTLGMLASDRLYVPDNPSQTLGIFMRCDRGAGWADHHTIFVIHDPANIKIHHSSYEVQDYDAVQIGGQWMQEKGWKREWGIGRHILGSQVFDYWRDPWGHMFEHYADGDLLTSTTKPGNHPALPEMLYQWGPPVSETFFN
jgi:catechol 2,3-dioxygenase-like lactoylglutathione lyase family enzyme